jgi:hypothetical protein
MLPEMPQCFVVDEDENNAIAWRNITHYFPTELTMKR